MLSLMYMIFGFCLRVKQLNKQSKIDKLTIYKKQDVESAPSCIFGIFISPTFWSEDHWYIKGHSRTLE